MIRIKKIDKLIFTSFLPPFFAAMMVAIFVLLMQTLWLYIDEIAGKGLGFFIVVELLAYKCVSLIPLALPIAILIASVMVMGNMAERYELSSFKSAGVPLLRIMRSLLLSGVLAGLFSFYCSNYLIPVANLKFGSRMYDISRQKPALRLDAGVFNYDFQGYAIHIGDKGRDGKSINDILIYDHSKASGQEFSQIVAESGEMFATGDGEYFVMNLHNGHQYVETREAGSGGSESPFIRTSFREWNKVFDLGEFQLSRTDEELFKSNRSMLTISQLAEAVDSISLQIKRREVSLSNHFSNYFSFLAMDSTFIKEDLMDSTRVTVDYPSSFARATLAGDTSAVNEKADTAEARTDSIPGPAPAPPDTASASPAYVTRKINRKPRKTRESIREFNRQFGDHILTQEEKLALDSVSSILETWPVHEQRRVLTKSKSYVRSVENQAESALRFLEDLLEDRVKHRYDMHTKYGMAVVCFIFILIGSPMGAIVRKGGFGYPILISIIFFMLFVVLTIFCRKVAESFVLPAVAAAWVPCAIMLPIGIFLTRKAMNDSKMLSLGKLGVFLRRIFRKKEAKAQ